MKSSGWLTAPKRKNCQKRSVRAGQVLFPKLHHSSNNCQQKTIQDYFTNETQSRVSLGTNDKKKDLLTTDVKENFKIVEPDPGLLEETDKDANNLEASIKVKGEISQQTVEFNDVFISKFEPKKLQAFHESSLFSTSFSHDVIKFLDLPVKDREHTKTCGTSDALHSAKRVVVGSDPQFSCHEASDHLTLCTQEPILFEPITLEGTELDLSQCSSEDSPTLHKQVPTKLVNISRDNMELNICQSSSDLLTLDTQELIRFEPLSIVGTELDLDNSPFH